MGAFFLFKTDEVFDAKAARKVFADKGNITCKEFALGDLTLWLFRKQLIKEDNYMLSKNQSAIFAVGTIVYKAKSYRESLSSLLDDFEANRLDYDEMIGAFCLIFLKNRKVHMLTDRANICHIFANSSNTMLSSSFLALLSAQTHKLPLNKPAFLEQLLIGYIAAPDTSVSGIYLADALYQKKVKSQYYTFLSHGNTGLNEHNNKIDFNVCVKTQLDILRVYYNSINLLATQYGVDIGLSGGYDSRLNLLLSKSLAVRPSAHTYYSPDHLSDLGVAEKLAAAANISLKKVLVTLAEAKSEFELSENLNDALFFFDGRTNENMGTYNDAHTRKLRCAILASSGLGLNGLGGELYRNREHLPDRKIRWRDWLKYYVIKPHGVYAVTRPAEITDLMGCLCDKYFRFLPLREAKYFNKRAARIFYRNIWLPFAAGVKNSAENQLAFFLMPFADSRVTRTALNATPHIGISGKFEAAMLKTLDENVAKMLSGYGFGLDREPLAYLLKAYLKGMLPNQLKSARQHVIMSLRRNNSLTFLTLVKTHAGIRQIFDLLRETSLPIDWNRMMQERTNMERAIFLGHFLYRFADKVSF